MMHMRVFYPSDLVDIVPQSSQVIPATISRAALGADFAKRGPCWTMKDKVGRRARILAVGGFCDHAPHHASLWAVMAENKRGGLVYLTKYMSRKIAERLGDLTMARLDMTVDPADFSAVRWAIMLGFRFEGAKRCYGAQVQTMHEYVIIRDKKAW